MGGRRYHRERSCDLRTNHECERKSNGAVGAETLLLNSVSMARTQASPDWTVSVTPWSYAGWGYVAGSALCQSIVDVLDVRVDRGLHGNGIAAGGHQRAIAVRRECFDRRQRHALLDFGQ